MKPMLPGRPTRHFVTLCDSAFLPMALCLHASLLTHSESFGLWILCLDEEVEGHLRQLALPHVSLIPLRDVESEALLRIKSGRTAVEYCWTLTPFAPEFVFERDPGVRQVTYLDADLCFFDSPEILLKELEASGKSVLITEHAYAPEYDQTATSGRFCVQFLTISRTDGGERVMKWWQARCLEWCFNRLDDGRFGDQKYLDDWPERFADEVHVVRQVERTLAPWNVRHFERLGETRAPVFYHFHSLRVVSRRWVRLYSGYEIGALGSALYDRYLHALRNSVRLMDARQIDLKLSSSQPWGVLRWLKRRISGVVEAYARLD